MTDVRHEFVCMFVLMKLSGCSSQQFLKTNTSMNSNVFLYLLTISHIIEEKKKKKKSHMHAHTHKKNKRRRRRDNMVLSPGNWC